MWGCVETPTKLASWSLMEGPRTKSSESHRNSETVALSSMLLVSELGCLHREKMRGKQQWATDCDFFFKKRKKRRPATILMLWYLNDGSVGTKGPTTISTTTISLKCSYKAKWSTLLCCLCKFWFHHLNVAVEREISGVSSLALTNFSISFLFFANRNEAWLIHLEDTGIIFFLSLCLNV